jgi:hypothetical protein
MYPKTLYTKIKTPIFADNRLNPNPRWYFSLEQGPHEGYTKGIIRFIWGAVLDLFGHDVIYDSDIEAQIFGVGYCLGQFTTRMFSIAPEHLFSLRTVCKDMLREQIVKLQSGTLEDEDSPLDAEIWSRWLSPTAEAFGWQSEEPAGQLEERNGQVSGLAVIFSRNDGGAPPLMIMKLIFQSKSFYIINSVFLHISIYLSTSFRTTRIPQSTYADISFIS